MSRITSYLENISDKEVIISFICLMCMYSPICLGIILSKPLYEMYFQKSLPVEKIDKYFHVNSTITLEFSEKHPVSIPCVYVVVDGTIREDQLVITGTTQNYAGFLEKLTIAPIADWNETPLEYSNLCQKSLEYHKQIILNQQSYNDAVDQYLANPAYIQQLEKFYLASLCEQLLIFIANQHQYGPNGITWLTLAFMLKVYPYLPDRVDTSGIVNNFLYMYPNTDAASLLARKSILQHIDGFKFYFPNLSLNEHIYFMNMVSIAKLNNHLYELIKSFGSKMTAADMPVMQSLIVSLLDRFFLIYSMDRNIERPSLFEGPQDQLFRVIFEHWKFFPDLKYEDWYGSFQARGLSVSPSLVSEVLALLEFKGDTVNLEEKVKSIKDLMKKNDNRSLASLDYALCLKGKSSSPLVSELIQSFINPSFLHIPMAVFMATSHFVRLFDALLKDSNYLGNISNPKIFEPLLLPILNFPESVLCLLINSSISSKDLKEIMSKLKPNNFYTSLLLISYHLSVLNTPNLILWKSSKEKLVITIPDWLRAQNCTDDQHKYIVQYILLKYCQVPYDFSLKFMNDITGIVLEKYENLMNLVFQEYLSNISASDPETFRKLKNIRIQVLPTTEPDLIDMRSSSDSWLASYQTDPVTKINHVTGLGVLFSKDLADASELSKLGLQAGFLYYLNQPIELSFTLSTSKEVKMIPVNRIAIDPDLSGKILCYPVSEENRFLPVINPLLISVQAKPIEIIGSFPYASQKKRTLDFLLAQIDAFPKNNPVEVFLEVVTKLVYFMSLSRDEKEEIFEVMQKKIREADNYVTKLWTSALAYYLFSPEQIGSLDEMYNVKIVIFKVLGHVSGKILSSENLRGVFRYIIRRLDIKECFVTQVDLNQHMAILTDTLHLLSAYSNDSYRPERYQIWSILNDFMDSFVESLANQISLHCTNPDKKMLCQGALDALKGRKQLPEGNAAYTEGYKNGFIHISLSSCQ